MAVVERRTSKKRKKDIPRATWARRQKHPRINGVSVGDSSCSCSVLRALPRHDLVPVTTRAQGQGAVNSNRESERVSRHFEDLGELLPWFAARALDEESS